VNPVGETRAATPLSAEKPAAGSIAQNYASSAPSALASTSPTATRRGTPLAIIALATIGALAIIGFGIFGVVRFVASDSTAAASAPIPSVRPSETALVVASVTPSAVASAAPSASASTVASTPVVPSAAPSASAQAQPRIVAPAPDWRKRGRQCASYDDTRSCANCCGQPGDILGPYPDCECLFDFNKWNYERDR
jgi:hypothetical protein